MRGGSSSALPHPSNHLRGAASACPATHCSTCVDGEWHSGFFVALPLQQPSLCFIPESAASVCRTSMSASALPVNGHVAFKWYNYNGTEPIYEYVRRLLLCIFVTVCSGTSVSGGIACRTVRAGCRIQTAIIMKGFGARTFFTARDGFRFLMVMFTKEIGVGI